jgi:hypothetical protein
MGVKLVAEFMGLMALVPQGDGKPADVLAVKPHAHHQEEHLPTLSVDVADLTHGLDTASSLIALPDGRRIATWDLRRKVVTFEPDAQQTCCGVRLRNSITNISNNSPCFPEVQWIGFCWRDLAWLPNVTLASGGKRVHRIHLEEPKDPARSPVDTIVRLRTGRLSAARPHAEELRDLTFRFQTDADDEDPTHERALTDHIRWEADAEDEFVIVIREFGLEEKHAIRIHVSPRVGSTAKIAFASLPRVGSSNEYVQPITHFVYFYRLLESQPDAVRFPHPTKQVPLPGRKQRKKAPDQIELASVRRAYAAASSSECPPAALAY